MSTYPSRTGSSTLESPPRADFEYEVLAASIQILGKNQQLRSPPGGRPGAPSQAGSLFPFSTSRPFGCPKEAASESTETRPEHWGGLKEQEPRRRQALAKQCLWRAPGVEAQLENYVSGTRLLGL